MQFRNPNTFNFLPIKAQPIIKFIEEPSCPNITILTDIDKISDREKQAIISNKRKILIVDDEKFNCDIIYGFLMILGIKNRSEIAEFAYNGEEALCKV